MEKKSIILLIVVLATVTGLTGCNNKEKTTILTNDVKKEAMIQKNQIKKIIESGTKFLKEGKYDDAKNAFEKAISMDKANENTYMEIKNKYMDKGRIDDAYYIIKLAISNNVDTDNMKKTLDDIKSKFKITRLDVSVNQNTVYTLPNKIKAKINNKDEIVDVVWKESNVDTSNAGSRKYKGKIEKYHREAQLNLKVVKIVQKRKYNNILKIGGVTKVYEKNNKRYLKFDEVEFFLDEGPKDYTAEKEAVKDGAFYLMDNGRLDDSYYIRNKNRTLATYEISSKAEIYVCDFRINKYGISERQKVNYEKFKNIPMNKGDRFDGILCNIYIENNVVTKIQEQYIP